LLETLDRDFIWQMDGVVVATSWVARPPGAASTKKSNGREYPGPLARCANGRHSETFQSHEPRATGCRTSSLGDGGAAASDRSKACPQSLKEQHSDNRNNRDSSPG